MSARQLVFRFVEKDVRGIVTLEEEFAPAVCDTLWEALKTPFQVNTMHAMFAGPEIMIGLPEANQTFDPTGLPPENQTCIPAAGDCLWFYQGKNMMRGLAEELWELGIFYGEGGRVFGPLGWTPVTIFGRMTENLPAFAAECADIRLSGAKLIEVGRREN